MEIIRYTKIEDSVMVLNDSEYNIMLFKAILNHLVDKVNQYGFAMLSDLTKNYTAETVSDHMYGWTKSNIEDIQKSHWEIELTSEQIILKVSVKEISEMMEELN